MGIFILVGFIVLELALVATIGIAILKKLPEPKTVIFNETLIGAYERWFAKNVGIYMTGYIEEKLGKEFKKLDELQINSEFAIEGIEYVCKNIIETIPNVFQKYMLSFYGEDKYIMTIHTEVKMIFMEFIGNERKKRIRNGNKAESN